MQNRQRTALTPESHMIIKTLKSLPVLAMLASPLHAQTTEIPKTEKISENWGGSILFSAGKGLLASVITYCSDDAGNLSGATTAKGAFGILSPVELPSFDGTTNTIPLLIFNAGNKPILYGAELANPNSFIGNFSKDISGQIEATTRQKVPYYGYIIREEGTIVGGAEEGEKASLEILIQDIKNGEILSISRVTEKGKNVEPFDFVTLDGSSRAIDANICR